MTVSGKPVLAIHYGHDANAALVVDGQLKGAIQEERLTRQKFHSGFPFQSVRWLLENAELRPSDIQHVVVIGASRQAETGGGNLVRARERFGLPKSRALGLASPWINAVDNYLLGSRIRSSVVRHLVVNALASIGLRGVSIEWIDHHFAHALGAFYSSGFESSLVITMDGKGDALSGSVRTFRYDTDGNLVIELVSESDEVDSMGFPYSCVTEFLGFKRLRHEGKVTGLAAFGDKARSAAVPFPTRFVEEVSEIRSVIVSRDQIRNDRTAIKALRKEFRGRWWSLLTTGAGLRGRYVQMKIDEFLRSNLSGVNNADVAAWVQFHTEEQVSRYVQALISNSRLPRKIALAGGLFANVRLNQVIREIQGVEEVFILPGMGDGGLAVGPAMRAGRRFSSTSTKFSGLQHVFLGPTYSEEYIREVLNQEDLSVTESDDIYSRIARLVHSGLVVGNFDGPMEWGPRALGNRSILASPVDATINDRLNCRLHRTEFMPFAPMILDSIAHEVLLDYRDTDRTAEFMTITYAVRPEWRSRIPAVVHVDGTARPQIVRKTNTPRVHQIIEQYKKLSGLGVIINTSFNVHEEPIVASPQDAIRSLRRDAVDVLAISNFLVTLRNSNLKI